jgi:hypothetical protein
VNPKRSEPANATESWRVLVLLLGYTGLRWGKTTALRVPRYRPGPPQDRRRGGAAKPRVSSKTHEPTTPRSMT